MQHDGDLSRASQLPADGEGGHFSVEPGPVVAIPSRAEDQAQNPAAHAHGAHMVQHSAGLVRQ